MRNGLQVAGLVLLAMGISGAIDHLWVQPVLSPVLNVFQRHVFPRVDLLAEHALLANAGVAVLGLLLLLAADPGRRR